MISISRKSSLYRVYDKLSTVFLFHLFGGQDAEKIFSGICPFIRTTLCWIFLVPLLYIAIPVSLAIAIARPIYYIVISILDGTYFHVAAFSLYLVLGVAVAAGVMYFCDQRARKKREALRKKYLEEWQQPETKSPPQPSFLSLLWTGIKDMHNNVCKVIKLKD